VVLVEAAGSMVALGRAVLGDHPTRSSFGDPEAILQ
jgi:hypothetical protein